MSRLRYATYLFDFECLLTYIIPSVLVILFPTGNVTGSNAVNVFLGLGTPWMIATIYWATMGKLDLGTTSGNRCFQKYSPLYKDEDWFKRIVNKEDSIAFVSPAGDLGPSVLTFTCLAFSCVAVLMFRRKFAGGELGGPDRLRNITCVTLISFWFIYIAVSATIAYTNYFAACATSGSC